jgi:hypothetical protein
MDITASANIKCPNCGYQIPISEALQSQIRGELEISLKAEHNERLARAVAEAERRARGALDLELTDLKNRLAEDAEKARAARERELALLSKTRQLEEAQQVQAERIRAELEEGFRKAQAEQMAKAAAAAEARVREQSALELAELKTDLAAQRDKALKAEQAELALRKEKTLLEERARNLDLEVARKLDAEKHAIM